jgi:hypothetical protein
MCNAHVLAGLRYELEFLLPDERGMGGSLVHAADGAFERVAASVIRHLASMQQPQQQEEL